MRPNNTFQVKLPPGKFLRAWMEFLTPYHHLTAREKDVAARILEQYFRFKKVVDDDETLKELLWSHTSRKDMRESLSLSQPYFQAVLASLKQHGFLTPDGGVESRYIPRLSGDPAHMLLVLFDWSTPQNPVANAT
jgi:phage terminase large subunit GpA-like protein